MSRLTQDTVEVTSKMLFSILRTGDREAIDASIFGEDLKEE